MSVEAHADPDIICGLVGALIVSCQAPEGSPMRDPYVTARVAEAAVLGGAKGLRVNGVEDIEAVRAVTQVPIIGLFKVPGDRRPIITPTLEHAEALVRAGADIVAIDCSDEVRGGNLGIVASVRETLGVPVMADVSTLLEGTRAWTSGAELVGTTLSGYTPETAGTGEEPDLALVTHLAGAGVRVVAEGRIRTPEDVAAAFSAGAYSVVVGGAITDPLKTTELFSRATPSRAL